MPRDGELAQRGVEVEVDALADRRAHQRRLQAVEQPPPARLLQDLRGDAGSWHIPYCWPSHKLLHTLSSRCCQTLIERGFPDVC